VSAKVATASTIGTIVGIGIGICLSREYYREAPPREPIFTPNYAYEIASLKADNARLVETNGQLSIALSTGSSPASTSKSLTLGVPLFEVQRAILGNLRQIDAARDQFQLDHGRPATTIVDLVDANRYIKRLRTISGEDYSGLNLSAGQKLTVTTPDGATITYDPSGTGTTKIDVPPAEARAEKLEQKIADARQTAIEAYRLANEGRDPGREDMLVPFFTTPQDGADFVEYLEAKEMAQKSN
jgi:hypothetical protein